MIEDLESHNHKEDLMAGSVTNVIAIADDVAPFTTAENPREAIHMMQMLLNIVEDMGPRTTLNLV